LILIDTSVWVEFLRGTGSAADERIDRLLADDSPIATTDVVLMELLAGAGEQRHRQHLRKLLARCEFIAVEGPGDYERAAGIYRACRRGGETVRKLTDCLIAQVAMRSDCELLHADGDFSAIARHVPLGLA